ncbi:carboxypeptidase-like regulatory domain-containing protein [Arenibacter sp. S6351L]|uniref:carboxypeptidase-like regulatory domain-containing protein n=1 Tax=Arenibacter sp. S6351L TaxID=2926407 RepID=UPI001FF43419|nr:carboxypeptidase-like regulatory domain-containing protein [Arenibacter sp. S6351L]MCK0134792.1 TonB-dependent receptor plug domain-containing protein [Arenibacter sp. S6351L]
MTKKTKLRQELPRKFKFDMVIKPSLTLLLGAMVAFPSSNYASETNVLNAATSLKTSTYSSEQSNPQQQITGVVLDNNGLPLPGANILEKGTTNGTQTDFDGEFSISVSNPNAVLVVSYLGFVNKEISVSGQSSISVTLEEDASQLEEVVVTALGITREKKALGYAVQELSGDDIKNTSETNVINALAGKSAGVLINNSNGNVGASSRITIRGNQSLTGNNQPLFVVDGIPIDNTIVSSTRGGYDFTDMGNGAADINPSDIAEMTILKGGNAAALYGSRGANGVVLIWLFLYNYFLLLRPFFT